MGSFKICIAGYVFKLNIDDDFLFTLISNKYSHFASRKPQNVTMNFHFHRGKKIYKIRKSDFNRKIINFKMIMKDEEFFTVIHDNFYLFDNILASIIYYWLLRKNILVLHASGVIKNKKAYIFSGKPGAGKTTIAKFSKGTIMNDNEIIIRRINSQFIAFSSPLQRRDLATKNEYAPISAIFFLKRRNFKRIKKLKPDETFKRLVMNHYVSEISYKNKEDIRTLFTTCHKIAKNVASYELSFQLTDNIWREINEITKKNS